jgi:hypothetical protein
MSRRMPHGESRQVTAPQLTRTVTVPSCDAHDGFHSVTVTLLWQCPRCGGPRGEVFRTISYDGSRRLACDGWRNPCGHIDYYSNVRREAGLR